MHRFTEEGQIPEGFPYHLNAKDNPDLVGQQLLVDEGAWCHYPDEVQQELGLYPWADQSNGPWVVALGVGIMMTHYTMAFCMQCLNVVMPNWQDYLHGNMDGHLHMKIPTELAELLSGDHVTVVMQSNKMMIALYRTFGLQFLHDEHIYGHYGHEPGYICKSWITLDEHGLSTFMDQAMLPTELTSSQQLQFAHFPKSSLTAWGFDGRTHDQRTQSMFWQKKAHAMATRDKLNRFSMWYNPLLEASFVVKEVGVSLSRLEANHKLLCLRHTITMEGIE